MRIKANDLTRAARTIAVCIVFAFLGCDTSRTENVDLSDDQKKVAQAPLWHIEGCEVFYQDKPLTLGGTVVSWEKVLGKHDRYVNSIYVFDHHGLKLYEVDGKIMSAALVFKNHQDYSEEYIAQVPVEDLRDSYRRSNLARPKREYSQKVSVEGGLVQADMDINSFNKQRLRQNPQAKPFTEGYLPTIYHLYRHCTEAQSLLDYVGLRIEFERGSRTLVQQFSIGGENK